MAKIKINFDDSLYNIDESSLSSPLAELQSHFLNKMNGSGEVLHLGGTSYNIDSTKLSNTANKFITHLGTIAGNGRKVVVNGTEYNVDSAKVQDAVDELHVILGGLSSEGDNNQMPEKNAYGFYFNVPYVGEVSGTDYSYTQAYVFYENGEVVYFDDSGNLEGLPDDATELLPYSSRNQIVDYNNLTDSGFIFSEDGKTVTDIDGYTGTAQGVEHGIYFGETYVGLNGDTFTPYESNKIVFNGEYEEILRKWGEGGHYGYNYGISVYASTDGTVVYAGSRFMGLNAFYFDPRP